VLSGFQEMGMHEANNIALTHLALNCYSLLRPAYPAIVNVLAQVRIAGTINNTHLDDMPIKLNKIMSNLKMELRQFQMGDGVAVGSHLLNI